MSQTTYSRAFSGALSGQLSDTHSNRVESFVNGEGSDIPAGIGVCARAGSEGQIEEIDASTDIMCGVTVLSYARNPNDLTGSDAIKAGDTCNVMTEGSIFVQVEQTVVVGDPVYVRHTSDGASNTQLGRFRKDADTANAMLVKGARFLKGASAGGVAEIYFSASAEWAARIS